MRFLQFINKSELFFVVCAFDFYYNSLKQGLVAKGGFMMNFIGYACLTVLILLLGAFFTVTSFLERRRIKKKVERELKKVEEWESERIVDLERRQ